jgi:stage II sporulation protein AB (anti-sigma F factor)
MNNYLKMELLAIGSNESFARSAVAAFAVELSPTIEQLNDIKTAVSEAVTNCVVHAYPNTTDGTIYLTVNIFQDTISIEVSDKGVGIPNIEEAIQPFYTTRPEQERSGMGFTIMKTFMDEFEVLSDEQGTTIKMVKYIKKDGIDA